MADIRANRWEWFHYDNPDFQVQFRNNWIPAGIEIPDISIHWHDDVEFIYVYEGACYYEMENEVIEMTAEEGIFVNARQLHLIHAHEKSECRLMCLIFHPIILCSTEHVSGTYVKSVLENKDCPYIKLSMKTEWQAMLLQDIIDMEPFASDEKGHLKVMQYIFDIWDLIYRNTVNDAAGQMQEHDLISVGKMVSYIHSHYREKILLSDICEAGNVGKSKCGKLFEKYYNVTPMEFVMNYRLEKGAKLLEISDMQITDIAYETGFSDASYFSKAFSAHIGISPVRYRKIGKGMSHYYEIPRI